MKDEVEEEEVEEERAKGKGQLEEPLWEFGVQRANIPLERDGVAASRGDQGMNFVVAKCSGLLCNAFFILAEGRGSHLMPVY